MATMTDLELKAMHALVHNLFTSANGGTPTRYEDCGDELWSNCLGQTSLKPSEELPPKQMAALCGTLAQKGLVVSGGKGRDAWIRVTRAGYDAWVAAKA